SLPVVLQIPREDLDRNVRVGRQRVRVLRRVRRRIVDVVGRVLRERPLSERRLRVVAFERNVAEIEPHLPLMTAAPGVHEVREIVLQLPATLRTHLRVAAAADRDRWVLKYGSAVRQPRGEVAWLPVAMTVRR